MLFRSNFGGTLTNSNLIAGTKYLYISADGNLVFGGSPTGWDFFVGVKSDASGKAFGGLYYEAGVDQDGGAIDTYYGSLKAAGGVILQHQ